MQMAILPAKIQRKKKETDLIHLCWASKANKRQGMYTVLAREKTTTTTPNNKRYVWHWKCFCNIAWISHRCHAPSCSTMLCAIESWQLNVYERVHNFSPQSHYLESYFMFCQPTEHHSEHTNQQNYRKKTGMEKEEKNTKTFIADIHFDSIFLHVFVCQFASFHLQNWMWLRCMRYIDFDTVSLS